MTIPTLTTARLILRPPTLADFPLMEKLLLSDRARYMGGPYTPIGAWRVYCQDIALWQMFGHGALMMDLRDSGTCVGQVGINHGPLFPEKELGWLLFEGFEGYGYAAEAAMALRDWAFAELKLESLVSYIDSANHASVAVAERLGAVLDPDAQRHDPEDLVYRHWPT
ncbi:Protein N-acetyltransferase, RimJ/RimL family [Devosia sp. YR412]|nr:Protein N-acetyltransferase, RimJ/RimL family [Devosia sp. YR412]